MTPQVNPCPCSASRMGPEPERPVSPALLLAQGRATYEWTPPCHSLEAPGIQPAGVSS